MRHFQKSIFFIDQLTQPRMSVGAFQKRPFLKNEMKINSSKNVFFQIFSDRPTPTLPFSAMMSGAPPRAVHGRCSPRQPSSSGGGMYLPPRSPDKAEIRRATFKAGRGSMAEASNGIRGGPGCVHN